MTEGEETELAPVEEKFGIKETKEWFTFLIALGSAGGGKIAAGSAFGMMDLVTFMPVLMKLQPAIVNSKMVGKEVMDLSDPEKAELKAHIETLEVPANMTIEVVIEKGLKLMVDLADFVGDFFEEKNAIADEAKKV